MIIITLKTRLGIVAVSMPKAMNMMNTYYKIIDTTVKTSAVWCNIVLHTTAGNFNVLEVLLTIGGGSTLVPCRIAIRLSVNSSNTMLICQNFVKTKKIVQHTSKRFIGNKHILIISKMTQRITTGSDTVLCSESFNSTMYPCT
jgi:hypothetical protein